METIRCKIFLLLILLTFSCKNPEKTKMSPDHTTPKGMVWIPGGEFMQGAPNSDKMAMAHEKPRHKVKVDGFYMQITEVTNAQFQKFISETGYVTTAERAVNWQELKKQLPPDTPAPPDSLLQAGSLTFKKTSSAPPNLYDFSQWWNWTTSANWRHPQGPESNIEGKENYPVVQVSYEDALAYCNWAGQRLPTEAEWEFAARAMNSDAIFTWGNNFESLSNMANTWTGEFPVNNNLKDGYERLAPVKSFPANKLGLFDMAGNVWEWTNDWYNTKYYHKIKESKQTVLNPSGAEEAFNPAMPYSKEKVLKGGSFLCNASYCASFRISARMSASTDSSFEHVGFRTVWVPK